MPTTLRSSLLSRKVWNIKVSIMNAISLILLGRCVVYFSVSLAHYIHLGWIFTHQLTICHWYPWLCPCIFNHVAEFFWHDTNCIRQDCRLLWCGWHSVRHRRVEMWSCAVRVGYPFPCFPHPISPPKLINKNPSWIQFLSYMVLIDV